MFTPGVPTVNELRHHIYITCAAFAYVCNLHLKPTCCEEHPNPLAAPAAGPLVSCLHLMLGSQSADWSAPPPVQMASQCLVMSAHRISQHAWRAKVLGML